jgi:hypothetical protein
MGGTRLVTAAVRAVMVRRPIAAIVGVACVLAVSCPVATAGAAVFDFPSRSSTVVASVGFIDAQQIGSFWSVSRGDRVSQSFAGPDLVNRAILQLDVVTNVLNQGLAATGMSRSTAWWWAHSPCRAASRDR